MAPPRNPDDKPSPPQSSRTVRWRRWLTIALISIVALLAIAELVARFGFGLGNPPLYIADPQIEYLLKPDQDLMRYGNRYVINQWSMRSGPIEKKRTDPDERRILMLGDSVLHGGVLTDQSELATMRLQRDNLRVMNVSAGSWGPANLLAYVERFGFFEADVIVVLLSSHDAADVPTHETIVGHSIHHPDRKPRFALGELLRRYLMPRWRDESNPSHNPEEGRPDVDPRAIDALIQLLSKAKATGAKVLVAQHLERDESPADPMPGHDAIKKVAEQLNLPVVQLGPAMQRDPANYRDPIHPGPAGQKVIAEQLAPHLMP